MLFIPSFLKRLNPSRNQYLVYTFNGLVFFDMLQEKVLLIKLGPVEHTKHKKLLCTTVHFPVLLTPNRTSPDIGSTTILGLRVLTYTTCHLAV
jgi:hypothetical protein